MRWNFLSVAVFLALGCGGTAAHPNTPQALTVAPFSLALSPNITIAVDAQGRLTENEVQIGILDRDGRLMNGDGDELAHLNGDGSLVVASVATEADIVDGAVREAGAVLVRFTDNGSLEFPARTDLGPFPLPDLPRSARTGVLFMVAAYFSLVDLATANP